MNINDEINLHLGRYNLTVEEKERLNELVIF